MIAKARVGLLAGIVMAGAVPPAAILASSWNGLWPHTGQSDTGVPPTPVATTSGDPSAADRLAAGFDALTKAPDKPAAPLGLDRYAETPLIPPPTDNVKVVATHVSPLTGPAATAPQPVARVKPILPPVPPAPRLAAIEPELALVADNAPADPAGRAIAPDPVTADDGQKTAALDQGAGVEPPATLPQPPQTRVPAVDIPANYRKLIESEAAADHVPANLALAVVALESGFKADKHGDDGKLGLFQLRYAIAKALGFKGASADLTDPAVNVKWGMKYLAGAYKKADGDTCKTAMKFVAGHYQEDFKPIHAAYCDKLKDRMAALE